MSKSTRSTRKPRKKSGEAQEETKSPPSIAPLPDPGLADARLLDRFPPRSGGPRRPIFFDWLPNAATLLELVKRGYEPTHILSLPRDDERGHRTFLTVLTQAMSEGTIPADKNRLHAAELDMRAHGMLNKYGPADPGSSKRKQAVEDLLADWQRGRHSLGQSTVVDPVEVERMLRSKAGVLALLPEEKRGKMKHKWRRKSKGASE